MCGTVDKNKKYKVSYADTNTRLSLDKVVLVENVAINAQVQTLKWNGF